MTGRKQSAVLVAVLVGATVLALAGEAAARPSRHRALHARHAPRAAIRVVEPARMIEIRPGWFIGSHECVDERLRPSISNP